MLLKLSPLQVRQGSPGSAPTSPNWAWVLLTRWAPTLGWVTYALFTTRLLQAMMLFPLEKHSHSHFIMLIATHAPPPPEHLYDFTLPNLIPQTHTEEVSSRYICKCTSQCACELFTEKFSFPSYTPSFLCFTWHTVSSQWKVLAFLWLILRARPRDVSNTRSHIFSYLQSLE